MTIKKDCIVTIDYHINDTEGNLLHEEEESLVYLHGGYGHIFPTVEKALEGKSIGEAFKVELSADKAFGNYDSSLIITEVLSELPAEVSIGMELDGYFEDDSDDVIIYTVTDIEGDHATLDGNHPLAGLDLVFEGTILDIHEATSDEIKEVLEFQHQH
ncbi:FKBP-type peptidyl-prolyl cis-trans isomerase [Sulfuricurvum sp.]|uniref:FKBP-type peptidyl-prolyl cis-trans isomerase n=1 Tax=Sulfuricurvum sp. TaxID=2025608 RepID=UPI003BB7C02D